YHPRKRQGFGLTDGEGCERVWHSISKLIAVLRVCGYHQRLYTLDRQILNARVDIQERLGQWLVRRHSHALTKRTAAETVLAQCGQTDAYLREQWDNQVKAQTLPLPKQSKNAGRDAVETLPLPKQSKNAGRDAVETLPLPKQSKNAGRDAVEHFMELRKARDILKERVAELLGAMTTGGSDAVEAELELEDARNALKRHETTLRAKYRALGIDQRHRLEKLISNKYYGVLINARAAKKRLRDRLRMRKFELDRLERSFRKQSTDQKLNEHVASAVKRREPGISALAALYN
ncbi:hypothetical protein H0H92_012597, partial [Tricholoma furcatifolium]